MRYYLTILIVVIALPLMAAPGYMDSGVSFSYTPRLEALNHPWVQSSTTYVYGPVKTLALKIGFGTLFTCDEGERTGFFGKYFYSSMEESSFQAVMFGLESKFLSCLKASFGVGYTWFADEIPYDENYPEDKSDFSSLNITASLGMEFNITEDFMAGFGVEYLPRGMDWKMLRAGRGTYYLEFTKRFL